MKFFKDAFATLQKIGKSLMLPVSVLPVAGILLGVGSAKLSWLPEIVSNAKLSGAISTVTTSRGTVDAAAFPLSEISVSRSMTGFFGWKSNRRR